MFDSLKKWIDSLEDKSHLFKHAEDEAIHVALASLLYHLISADEIASDKEKHLFTQIMENEFNLSHEQIASLYRYVKTLQSDLKTDLETVNQYLKDNPNLRMVLMRKLNQLIAADGVKTNELTLFYDAMQVIFPEITNEDSDF